MSEWKALVFLIKLLKQQLKRDGANLQMRIVESDMGLTNFFARDEVETADEATDSTLSLLYGLPLRN